MSATPGLTPSSALPTLLRLKHALTLPMVDTNSSSSSEASTSPVLNSMAKMGEDSDVVMADASQQDEPKAASEVLHVNKANKTTKRKSDTGSRYFIYASNTENANFMFSLI